MSSAARPPLDFVKERMDAETERQIRVKKYQLVLGCLCVLLVIALALGWRHRADQRSNVESARKVLKSPVSDGYQRYRALEDIEKSGPAGRDAIPELILMLSSRFPEPGSLDNRGKAVEILRKLGPDAAEAIPTLMLLLDQSSPDKTVEVLDAIDLKWRDRPEVPSVAEKFLGRAIATDHNGHLMGTSEERMEGALALHRLLGDDTERAHRILAPDSFNRRNSVSPKHDMAYYYAQRIDKLLALLVENLEGSRRKTALFLLTAIDPNWAKSAAARKAFPDLVVTLLQRFDAGDERALAQACDRVVELVSPAVVVQVCMIWDFKERHGANGTRLLLLSRCGPEAKGQVLSVVLENDRWLRLDIPSYRVLFVEARLQELAQLDANWVKHPKATVTIPELICLAAYGYPNEQKLALNTLDQIDLNWAKHPNAKLAVPVLAGYLSLPRLEHVLQSEEEKAREMIRAAEMLNRLGPSAREALPTLILARATGLHPNDSFGRGVRPDLRQTLEPLLTRMPDSVDPDWADAAEALPVVPELIKLLEKKPASAAEMLGRFGPTARCALPAIKAARLRVEKSPADVKMIDEAIKRIATP